MKLRDYQNIAVDSIFTYFQTHSEGNPLLALPTGTGKSVIIGEFVRKVLTQYSGQRIMMLTHVKELIAQNYEKLKTLWPMAPAGIYSAGLKQKDIFQSIIYGGVASVHGNEKLFGKIDLILIDECHLVNPKEVGMYAEIIKKFKSVNPYLRVIGFTATKWRSGHGEITEDGIFTDVCCDMTTEEWFRWFIAEGYLAKLLPKRVTSEFDIKGITKQAGDFVASQLEAKFDKYEVTSATITESEQIAKDCIRWLGFCAGIQHVLHTTEIMQERGFNVRYVHSKMTDAQRDENIRWFKERTNDRRVLLNNGVLTTGFDCPHIDYLFILRPTASSGLWVQILGRGTRPDYASGFNLETREGRLAAIAASKKQYCLVGDFGGNTHRLGPINAPVIPRRGGKGSGEAPSKDCPTCQTINAAASRFCISCGYEFPFVTKIYAEAGSKALIKEGEDPIIEEFEVQSIEYSLHQKQDKASMVKVSYNCGLNFYNTYVCIGHENHFADRKAKEWINFYGGTKDFNQLKEEYKKTPKEDAIYLLAIADKLKVPTHIRVWVNKKFPEIMHSCFDGTKFGKVQVSDTYQNDVQVIVKRPSGLFLPTTKQQDIEDDIPF